MFREHVQLKDYTSYNIGGPARYFFEARSIDELKDALREARKKNLEVFILGGGTNLLVSDEGFNGLMLKPGISFIERRGNEISVGAGVSMNQLLDYAIAHSLSGLEWAGGLPGTVGGAVRGNAGAFGGEMKDIVTSVRSFDAETFREIERGASAADFGYRSSVFKKRGGKEIILSAAFALEKGNAEAIGKSVREKIDYRRERHPLEYPNIGSIFKNVPLEEVPAGLGRAIKKVVKTDPFPVVPTAYLISEAGLKGVSFGGAMISSKHPNFIVNALQAKASEVQTLIRLAKNKVEKKFGIALEEEIIQL